MLTNQKKDLTREVEYCLRDLRQVWHQQRLLQTQHKLVLLPRLQLSPAGDKANQSEISLVLSQPIRGEYLPGVEEVPGQLSVLLSHSPA